MNLSKCEFRAGDLVCLKSGSKPMTVLSINEIDGFELTVAKELRDWSVSFMQFPVCAVVKFEIPPK